MCHRHSTACIERPEISVRNPLKDLLHPAQLGALLSVKCFLKLSAVVDKFREHILQEFSDHREALLAITHQSEMACRDIGFGSFGDLPNGWRQHRDMLQDLPFDLTFSHIDPSRLLQRSEFFIYNSGGGSCCGCNTDHCIQHTLQLWIGDGASQTTEQR